MRKLIFTLKFLLFTNTFAQENSYNANLINVNQQGNADIKDLKINGSNLFFTGKEFLKRNFAKYNFSEGTYTTYTSREYILDDNNTNYVAINEDIYYKSNYNTIKKSNNSNEFEVFFSGNEIIDLKQISPSHFTFINKRPTNNTNRNFYYDLYLYNQSTHRLTNINQHVEDNLNVSISNLIFTPNHTIYYKTSNDRYFKYDIETAQLIRIDTTLPNVNLISIHDEIFAIENSSELTKNIYKLTSDNQFEYVQNYTNQEVDFTTIQKLIEHNGQTYFISNRKLFVLNAENNTIQHLNSNDIESFQNLQLYHDEIFISLKSAEDEIYKTYRINNNQVHEFTLPTNDSFTDFIVYDDKIFYNYSVSDNYQIKYYDLITRETNAIPSNYNFPNGLNFTNPFIYNHNLYFNATSKFDGSELFKFNQENNEVEVVKNYNNYGHSNSYQFKVINDHVLFFANENHIYNLDVENNTVRLLFDHQKNIFRSTKPEKSINLGNKLIFSNENFELGFTDGTPFGTTIFQKIAENENALEYSFEQNASLNQKAFFRGNTLNQGEEIWVSDGTPEGTFILKDIIQGPESSSPYINKDAILDNKLYFLAKKEYSHMRNSGLFVTEGTPETTHQISYNLEGNHELRIFGTYQNNLIFSERPYNNYTTPFYFLLNPITLEKTILNSFYISEYFFEFDHTLYISEFSSLGYYDENFQLHEILAEEGIYLRPLKQIGDKFYIFSTTNDNLYYLQDRQLHLVQENIFHDDDSHIFLNDKILFLRDENLRVDNTFYLKLHTIDHNGLHTQDVLFEDNLNHDVMYGSRITLINDKLYFSAYHPKHGQELFFIDYNPSTLNDVDYNQPIIIKSHFSIYPNPTKNEFYINSKTKNQSLKIDIFNLAGQKIKSIQNQSQEKIMTNDLSPGVYFIKISNGINIETKKLIIK